MSSPTSLGARRRHAAALSFSSIAKAVKRVAVKAGFPSNLTSRILRRSQITALWETDADPSWREKVANQSVGVAMTVVTKTCAPCPWMTRVSALLIIVPHVNIHD